MLMTAPNIQLCASHVLTGMEAISAPNGGSARVIHSLCCPVGGRPASPRERAKLRANACRHQATPSDAWRLSRLVKCPLSDTERRPATLGT